VEDQGWIAWFCLAASFGRHFTIFGDGKQSRDFTYMDNVIEANLAALAAPDVGGRVYNIACGERTTLNELAEIVRETVPGCEIEYAADAGPDKRCYRVDCGKIARTLPEFEPKWNARLGAMQLYDAYRRIGLTKEDLDGPRYKRLGTVKDLIDSGILDDRLHRVEQAVASHV